MTITMQLQKVVLDVQYTLVYSISKIIFTALIMTLVVSSSMYAQEKKIHKLPSGPEGPGEFGAYYARLEYDPVWDKDWRIGDHPDIVVRFEDGAHKFVFWRGTSYIPSWVSENGIWYTNEFVERRDVHSSNTTSIVEPMSDKQCRYSQVRIIENNDARVVVHWRYAPVDVTYEHPFIDQETGWFDWVDEYYTIYPNAKGVRKITAHSSNLTKWMEFQEAIVINQPGTLPHENIQNEAISIANMAGEHITYVWDENGAPFFDKNPSRANIFKVNLKSKWHPFALVSQPKAFDNLITPYRGTGKNSFFNWWDHWPVSQDASDGRGAESADRPSHSSLGHIALAIDPPVDSWGTYGYHTVIRNKALQWTATDWGALDLMFKKPENLKGGITLSFDYANLWTSDIKLIMYDRASEITKDIELKKLGTGFKLHNKGFNTYTADIMLEDYQGDANLESMYEIYLEIAGSENPKTFSLDNLRLASKTHGFVYDLDFNKPDGTMIESLNLPDKAQWEPYAKTKNSVTKLMLHGMTTGTVEDLVPFARSWEHPATLLLSGNDFINEGYDPTEMAYVLKAESDQTSTVALTLKASAANPVIDPAFIVKHWGDKPFHIKLNGNALENGKDYRFGYRKTLQGTDLILWLDMERTNGEDQIAIEPF
ncbi:hypothetical protein [Seonamhaeicola sp.]|uniref:hypothetical protein n=1 Tax=Seonamhaeicola sp. TaxID=1912245 RepID=UPI0026353F1F|nr:hypothetical protein [Seonamhaeicola sp.]